MPILLLPSPSDYLSVQDAPAHLVIQGLLTDLEETDADADAYRTALQTALDRLADRHQDALRLAHQLATAKADLVRYTASMVTT